LCWRSISATFLWGNSKWDFQNQPQNKLQTFSVDFDWSIANVAKLST
jgi:hypothetical protein